MTTINNYFEDLKNAIFVNRTQATNLTGLSYIGSTTNSMKTDKGEKYGITTYMVYLAPHKLSGYNVCPYATKECINSCIHETGHVRLEKLSGHTTIEKCRIKKTHLFKINPNFFMTWVIAEIAASSILAAKKGNKFAVRLNGTSDIKYEDIKYEGKNIFEIFPHITFYDYTKVPNRKIDNYPNYSLTFSYTGKNVASCLFALDQGQNVAIVFNVKRGQSLPDFWRNYPVLDGDLYDYRPADQKQSIVGLRFKVGSDQNINETAKNSVFVVDPDHSSECAYSCPSNKIELPF